MTDRDCDICVVGAGIAGLSAALDLTLAGRDVLILEAQDRVGGRMRSGAWSDVWYNIGTQYVGGGDTPVAELARELGIELRPIVEPTVAMHAAGKLVRARLPITFALRLPIPVRAKCDLIRVGLRLRRLRKSLFSGDAETRRRERSRLEEVPFARLIKPCHPVAERFFENIVEMMTSASSENISAYLGLLFTPGIGEPRDEDTPVGEQLLAVRGGTDQIARKMAGKLGDRIRLKSTVQAIAVERGGVTIMTDGAAIAARCCILAVPAPIAASLIRQCLPKMSDILQSIGYGSFATVALHVKKVPNRPWADLFHIELQDRPFHVINHLTLVQDVPDDESVFLALAASDRATRLLAMADEDIVAQAQSELARVFPTTSGRVVATALGRWPSGLPFWPAGTLSRRHDLKGLNAPIVFAGDYMDYPNLQGALRSGHAAASKAKAVLPA